jgi:hypothetical protein
MSRRLIGSSAFAGSAAVVSAIASDVKKSRKLPRLVNLVIASEAKQSRNLTTEKAWIASA